MPTSYYYEGDEAKTIRVTLLNILKAEISEALAEQNESLATLPVIYSLRAARDLYQRDRPFLVIAQDKPDSERCRILKVDGTAGSGRRMSMGYFIQASRGKRGDLQTPEGIVQSDNELMDAIRHALDSRYNRFRDLHKLTAFNVRFADDVKRMDLNPIHVSFQVDVLMPESEFIDVPGDGFAGSGS
jgi:hypothetical protein